MYKLIMLADFNTKTRVSIYMKIKHWHWVRFHFHILVLAFLPVIDRYCLVTVDGCHNWFLAQCLKKQYHAPYIEWYLKLNGIVHQSICTSTDPANHKWVLPASIFLDLSTHLPTHQLSNPHSQQSIFSIVHSSIISLT